MTEPRTYASALDRIVGDRILPDGYDHWAIKSTRPDLTTRNGYRWPSHGVAQALGPILDHTRSCPQADGDGICIAKTYAGMAQGGYPARTMLLIAYRQADVLGEDNTKLRVREAFTVALLDGELLAREHLAGANLTRANLIRAYLARADLAGANLARANLTRANLADAYLARADLAGANLADADLTGAYLTGADLADADLTGANLARADLTGANLADADLARADLAGADLGDWERGPDGYARKKVTP